MLEFLSIHILVRKPECGTWDLGVPSTVLSVLMDVTMVSARGACDGASSFPRYNAENGTSSIEIETQAMFCQAGSITSIVPHGLGFNCW